MFGMGPICLCVVGFFLLRNTELSYLAAVPNQREHGRRNRGTAPSAAWLALCW